MRRETNSAQGPTVMPREVTIYRLNKQTNEVEKIPVGDSLLLNRGQVARNYHERILQTYHELECAGDLKEYGPRQKENIKRIHTDAQNPAYWPDYNEWHNPKEE